MDNPQFRRNLILVALFHLLVIAAIAVVAAVATDVIV
jgi:hypothetical protein